MKLKRVILLMLCLTCSRIVGSACDCSSFISIEEARISQYRTSRYIFLGEVVWVNEYNGEYLILVSEVFKGNIRLGDLMFGANYTTCGPYVDTEEEWLIYGIIKNEVLNVLLCGLSRSIENPDRNTYFSLPPPIQITKLNQQQIDLKHVDSDSMSRNRKVAISILTDEIEMLRSNTKQEVNSILQKVNFSAGRSPDAVTVSGQ